MSSFSRYFHTLRYLKPQQFYRRAWFRINKPLVYDTSAPALRHRCEFFYPPAYRRMSLRDVDTFVFLNESGALSDLGWDSAAKADSVSKLWRYNQHYFDDLNAVNAAERREWHLALLQCWIEENKPGVGVGWEPYPTSLRIVNWVKWQCAGNVLPETAVQSLAVQVRWLTQRIEWHILGNHLFANAKALIFAGLFFSGDEAERWLRKGLRIVAAELPEQVLADGGNFERSTMYHAIFLEDLLDLLNISGAYGDQIPKEVVARWRDYSLQMLGWLQGMTHPDGQIALFNDAAFGIAATADELTSYAGRVLGAGAASSGLPRRCAPCDDGSRMRLAQWADSGYIRLECADAVALLDVAPIGPDYLPGHAHADTLSFELSVFGQRVIVNGGTSRYGLGPERLRERRTVNHSTVEVDGQSSSEVWGGFRVARRAYPFDLTVSERSEVLEVACSHDGYKRLPGKPVHRRSWQFCSSHLVVGDSVAGGDWPAVARYILHPDVSVEQIASDYFHISLANGNRILIKIEIGTGRLEPARFAPEFGKVLATQCIVADLQSGNAQIRFSWG